MIEIALTVNGRRHERRVEPRLLLSDFLRHELSLYGTHVGCEHGVCGACTVLLDGRPARSCLTLAVQADGRDIRTVESLADGATLHPLQQAFHEHFGLQCGFCTPGILMTAAFLLEQNPGSDGGGGARRARRQPLPLHRLRADRRLDPGGGRREEVE